MTDAALVKAARTGDRDALAELLNRHRAMLLALCFRTLGDEDMAEEAAQEAALGAMLGLDGLRRPESFGAWLAGIGLNICRRWLRRRADALWSWEALTGGARLASSVDPHPDPADQVIATELAMRVRRAVEQLPPGQRRAVTLMYFEGMAQAEVAAELDIPVSAVKTRLHKGRLALRVRLLKLGEEMMASDTETMVPMDLREVVRTRGNEWPAAHAVVLAEVGGRRVLPIWIGESEATWLALAIEKAEVPRPGTYALMARTIEAMGGLLREVRISRLADEVFYAELVCEDSRGTRRTVDARPSDALNLAAILQAPIVAAPAVIEAAGAGRAAERVRRVLTEERTELVDAGTAELAAEARQRWTSAQARAQACMERLDEDTDRS